MKRMMILGLLLAMVIPSAVFVYAGISSGVPAGDTLSALVAQFSAKRLNLAMITVFAVAPVVVLALILWLLQRYARAEQALPALALGGLAPVLTVMAWVNFQYWPKYFPEQQHLSWPNGLEFVIGPIFFAPIGMALGMLTAFFVTRATRRAD